VTTDFRGLIEALADHQVDFVVIGGVALVLHGSPRSTGDLDVCYGRTSENLDRLANALAGFGPRLRGAPPDLPFRLDARTLRSGLNFTLTTARGDIDLLGEVPGVGTFSQASTDADRMDLYGRQVLVMSLDSLESAKRAAGRVKDLADLAHIREIRRLRGAGGGP
jgi:hypothetical protein